MNPTLHDSGERRTFSSGAQRDRGTLKPRPDLISPHAQMREGMIFALGAEKYTERNWELGMEISECIASAQRHIEQWKLGFKDEDHLAQARWNLGAILHYEEEIKAGRMDPKFANMPHYAKPKPGDQRMGPDGPEIYVELTGVGGWNSLGVDPAQPDQDYSICEIFRSPVTFYICGPMRGLPFLNFPAFDGARDLGKSLGHDIINPADMDRMYGIDPVEDPASPERVQQENPNFVHDVVQRDVEIILRLNKDRGDGLALLPDWQQSVGAMAEVRLAYWLGLKFVDARDWKSIDMDSYCNQGSIV